jgi:hypothetical protein
MLERRGLADDVDACKKAPDPLQHLGVVKFGGASAAARAHAEGKARVLVQRAPLDHQRRHRGHFGRCQFGGECMLLEDGVLAPAVRPVKLGDHLRVAFEGLVETDLVDPVFIGRQRSQAAVAP